MTREDTATRVAYARWTCETKRPFDTRAAATEVAGKRLALDAALRALYAYKCPACQKLHLTKKKVGKALVTRHEPANV
jgi:hypothetical protein